MLGLIARGQKNVLSGGKGVCRSRAFSPDIMTVAMPYIYDILEISSIHKLATFQGVVYRNSIGYKRSS